MRTKLVLTFTWVILYIYICIMDWFWILMISDMFTCNGSATYWHAVKTNFDAMRKRTTCMYSGQGQRNLWENKQLKFALVFLFILSSFNVFPSLVALDVRIEVNLSHVFWIFCFGRFVSFIFFPTFWIEVLDLLLFGIPTVCYQPNNQWVWKAPVQIVSKNYRFLMSFLLQFSGL